MGTDSQLNGSDRKHRPGSKEEQACKPGYVQSLRTKGATNHQSTVVNLEKCILQIIIALQAFFLHQGILAKLVFEKDRSQRSFQ